MGFSKNKLIEIEDLEDKRNYPRFTWVGNRISKADMEKLHSLKVKTKTPITLIVSQAVKEFLARQPQEQ